MSRVLPVNIAMVGRTGTEVVCCETARGLRRRGHDVAIYTQHDGATAEELRAEGLQVTSDLSSIDQIPDVIQANQTFPLIEATVLIAAAVYVFANLAADVATILLNPRLRSA